MTNSEHDTEREAAADSSKATESGAESRYAALALVGQLGLVSAAPIVLGVWLGVTLDEKFNGGGFFLLGCIALGIGGACVGAYRIVAPYLK